MPAAARPPGLTPDLESVEKWRNLPQNKPSRHALPPMMAGTRLNRTLLVGLGLVMLAALIVSLLFGR